MRSEVHDACMPAGPPMVPFAAADAACTSIGEGMPMHACGSKDVSFAFVVWADVTAAGVALSIDCGPGWQTEDVVQQNWRGGAWITASRVAFPSRACVALHCFCGDDGAADD